MKLNCVPLLVAAFVETTLLKIADSETRFNYAAKNYGNEMILSTTLLTETVEATPGGLVSYAFFSGYK